MDVTETQRLAAAVHQLRPDWRLDSLRTWIGHNLSARAYRDAAVALAWVAADPATKTPARVLENGPWWGATLTAGSDAQRHPSSTPIGELCHLHGTHRDTCPCNGETPARPAQESPEARRARYQARAEETRQALREARA